MPDGFVRSGGAARAAHSTRRRCGSLNTQHIGVAAARRDRAGRISGIHAHIANGVPGVTAVGSGHPVQAARVPIANRETGGAAIVLTRAPSCFRSSACRSTRRRRGAAEKSRQERAVARPRQPHGRMSQEIRCMPAAGTDQRISCGSCLRSPTGARSARGRACSSRTRGLRASRFPARRPRTRSTIRLELRRGCAASE